ncbi:response regulator [Salipiger mangrovisoli]|uniref:Response regulator n=1 Tax=Salipiger mangrovisoli TaxID=2865933 RepID=A0ABR9X837_9RHOB|nr:response regulator [Salipiger mangrovisoli]MBE9639678.1 response regulator [Salipiger mangrovisoli]
MAKVLICEDEAVVALDLQIFLEDAGFEVIGSFPTRSGALSAIGSMNPDLAVLDVRLADGEVFPVAERLKDMGVGLVFHSGHLKRHDVSGEYPDAEFCMKPVAPDTLIAALNRLDARTAAAPGALG